VSGCEFDVGSTRPLGDAASVLEGFRVGVGGVARRSRVYINWFERMGEDFFRDPGCLEVVIVRSSGFDHLMLRLLLGLGSVLLISLRLSLLPWRSLLLPGF